MSADEKKHLIRRRNFLPKRAFQMRLMLKIVLIVAISVAFSIVVTSAIFRHFQALQYRGDVPFQYLPEGSNAPAASPSALRIVLPAILISGLITILGAVVGGLAWSFRIAGPLYRFEACAEEIADGNLMTRVRVRHRDELHDVANVLDDMVAQLRDLHQKVWLEWQHAHELFHAWTDWVQSVGKELQTADQLDSTRAKALLERAGQLFADTAGQPTIPQIHHCFDRGIETCGRLQLGLESAASAAAMGDAIAGDEDDAAERPDAEG